MFGNNQMECMLRVKPPVVPSYLVENHTSFSRILSSIIINHRDEFALMRDGNVIRYYPHNFVAKSKGEKFYPDGRFCVFKVTEPKAVMPV